MQHIQGMHQIYSVCRLLFCTFLSTLMHFKHSLTANIQTNLYLPSKSNVFSSCWNYCMYTVYSYIQHSSKYGCFFTMRLRVGMRIAVRIPSEKALGHNIRDLPRYPPAQKELSSLISRAYNTKTFHKAVVPVTDINEPLKDMNLLSWKKETGLRLVPVTYPEHAQSLCVPSPSTGQGKSIFMDVIYWHPNPHLEH